MGHPILDQVKAEAEREALRKRKSSREKQGSNDVAPRKPTRARKPDVLKGHPPAHGECDEDRGHEDIIGNE